MAETDLGNIEIGIGGLLDGLRGLEEGDFQAQFDHLKELMADYDPDATIQFIEMRPPDGRVEEFVEVAESSGIPLRQFTGLYFVGGNETQPEALDSLREYLEIARKARTVERINLQVWGNNASPTVEALVDFYVAAEALAEEVGIELHTETHVERFTHDPRRLIAVHEALLDRTSGRLGLRVTADFSHYAHQIGNPYFPQWPAISSGELNLDPSDPDNYVSRNIIEKGLIGYGHFRMAVPNEIPPALGSIQYPVVDPRSDPETAHLPNGGMRQPWDASRREPWFDWYRQVFAYQLSHPERPIARFSTEFIGTGLVGQHYRHGDYRNLFQNIAMVSVAHKMVREVKASLGA